jgi:predicted NBD/HSP70 family sugar kinase
MAQFRDGHPTVRKYVVQKMEFLSLSIANLIKLMELDYLVLGGYLRDGGQDILDLIQRQVKSHLHPVQQTNLTIIFGTVSRVAQSGATVPLIDAFFELPLSV